MKRSMIFTIVLMVTLAFGIQVSGTAQLVFEENFTYTVGSLLTANGWTAHSGAGTNAIATTAPTISYLGYLSSNIGNEVTVLANGEDDNHTFPPQTSGSVYAGFLVNVTSTSATGDYFFHLGKDTIGTSFKARVFVKKDASNNVSFGITHTGGTTNVPIYTAAIYALNTTYLMVVKYTFVAGTANDIVSLTINPVLGASEPAPTVTAADVTPIDSPNIGSVALRQGTSSNAVNVKLDGIRVGLTWLDVAGTSTVVAPTNQTSNFTFSNVQQFQMDVAWTSGDGSKRIVKINTTNSFTAPVDGTDPSANTVYSGSGEQVIYNGTGNTIPTVTGLSTFTTYWFQAWEYNGTGVGTIYCTAVGANNPLSQTTTSAPTAPVITSPTATTIGQTSAVLGGNIISDGGSAITERGTVWSTTSPVTIADNKLAEGGTTTGIFTHTRTGLPFNTPIYYAAYATNGVGTTLTTESTFTTLLGEPSNHAGSFAANAPSYSSVVTTWLDNDGAQPATGFLVMANTTGAFTDPVDGSQPASDPVLNDGSGFVYVNHGVQTFTWTALNSSTPYYFKIYAYTNSGVNIDYKTVPDAPTANVTTPVFVNPVAAWTFDATPPVPNTPASVAADFGAQAGTAYLYADGTNGSSVWITATTGNELTTFGGNILNDPREGATIVAGNAYTPVNSTANGKSMVLKFSMSALQDAILTFAVRGTASGFNNHQWAWSTDGTNFTDFGSNTADNSTLFVLKTLDLSAVTQLNGAPLVYLRIIFSGATSSSGNNRLDNIVIRASAASTIPPTVATEAATGVSDMTAILNGTVNANNQSTDVTFEYGPDTGYGSTVTADQSPVTGGITTAVTANISGLTPNALYHFRVNGTSTAGTSYGNDLTFTTSCSLPGDPGEISGPANVCANYTEYQYTIPPIANVTYYFWTFPPGGTIVAGEGTNTVTVTFAPGNDPGLAHVYGTNDCGDESAEAQYLISVTQPLEVSVSIGASANPVTSGTLVTFLATPTNGGLTPSYQWKVNNSNVGANSDTYAYVPINNDVVKCVMTSSESCNTGSPATSNEIIMIVTGPPANLALTGTYSTAPPVCFNATNTVTVAGNNTTFEVYSNGSVTIIAGVNILYEPGTWIHDGGYMWGHIVPGGGDCSGFKVAEVLIVNEEKGLNLLDNSFKIYPNPTTGVFTIEQRGETTVNNVRVDVVGMLGGKVLTTELRDFRKQDLSIKGNPAGIYFVTVTAGENIQTVKMILTN